MNKEQKDFLHGQMQVLLRAKKSLLSIRQRRERAPASICKAIRAVARYEKDKRARDAKAFNALTRAQEPVHEALIFGDVVQVRKALAKFKAYKV